MSVVSVEGRRWSERQVEVYISEQEMDFCADDRLKSFLKNSKALRTSFVVIRAVD